MTMMKIWFAAEGQPHLNFSGEEKIRSIEIEDLNQIIQVKAFRGGFETVTTLQGNTLAEGIVWKNTAQNPEAAAWRSEVLRVLGEFRKTSQYTFKTATILQQARKTGPEGDIVEPVSLVSNQIDVYPNPIGCHGYYEWKYRCWRGTENSSNPLIRHLGKSNARVFPRYARKAFGKYNPGDFIGLGGPDAHLFKGDPEAVQFIREHTTIIVK